MSTIENGKSADRVDWSTVEAGRETDALVHERVFGGVVVSRDWPCGWMPDGSGYLAACVILDSDGGRQLSIPGVKL